MTTPTPHGSFEIEESTPNHWVATWNDIVLVIAYEGSSADVGHVHVGARAVDRVARRNPGRARLLFAVPPGHGRPPDAQVRTALVQTAKRFQQNVDRAAVVIAGEGFMAAVHRGAVTGLLALLRPKTDVKITRDVREALQFLGGTSEGVAALVASQEARFLGPG